MKLRFIPNLIVAALLLTASAGILSTFTACGIVAPGGVYQGDSFLFNAEQSILTGKQTLDVFVTWEYNNRKLLSGTPGITQSADAVRLHAKEWFATANRLRDAYAKSPTPDNKAALQKALDVINQAVKEALNYLVKYGPNR